MCFLEMPSLYCSLFVGAFVLNGAAVPAKQKMHECKREAGDCGTRCLAKWDTSISTSSNSCSGKGVILPEWHCFPINVRSVWTLWWAANSYLHHWWHPSVLRCLHQTHATLSFSVSKQAKHPDYWKTSILKLLNNLFLKFRSDCAVVHFIPSWVTRKSIKMQSDSCLKVYVQNLMVAFIPLRSLRGSQSMICNCTSNNSQVFHTQWSVTGFIMELESLRSVLGDKMSFESCL